MPRSIFSIGGMASSGITIEAAYINPEKVKQVQKLLETMPEIEMRAYNKGCTNFGRMLARYIKRCIMTNTPPPGVSWPAHSEDYLKNYDPKGFWYLSGQMLRSISVFQRSNGRYYVGPPPDEMAIAPVNRKGRSHPSKLTLVQLARIQELGSYTVHNDIPPRPLFIPSFKAVGGAARLQKYIVANLRREIKKVIT